MNQDSRKGTAGGATAAEHVNKALALVSQIPVSGNAVDVMALARNELFRAIEMLKEEAGKDGG